MRREQADRITTDVFRTIVKPRHEVPGFTKLNVYCVFVIIILWVSNEHSDWSDRQRYLFARAVQYGGLKNFRPGFVHKIVNISLVWGRSTQSECSLETQRIIKA